ncbi:alpha/beta fold hydrolase [Rhizobium alarense]|uniref:alpha/beta fold hydrolase n=1 Tax=Rhizobium alarense TaxID=2846851 RepID=UPI0038B51F39
MVAALADEARQAGSLVEKAAGEIRAAAVRKAEPPVRVSDPTVLLHGFAADRTAWRQVIPLLPADVEAVALDLPGHGSQAAAPAFGIEAIALALSDRLEALGISRAHVVGHSLGGAAGLALAALGRVAVRSVTLFAPGGLGPEIHGGFVAGLTEASSPEALDQWLGFMVADRSVLPDGYARAALRQMQRTGNAATLRAMADTLFPHGTQAFSLAQSLAGLAVPTRIVWGRSDRVVPAGHAARAPGFAAVHLLDGVGHVPQMEVPALAARLISETVRSAG